MLSLRLSAKELKKQDQVVKETPWPHHIETFKQVSQRTTHSNNRGEPRRDTFIYIEERAKMTPEEVTKCEKQMNGAHKAPFRNPDLDKIIQFSRCWFEDSDMKDCNDKII